MNSDAGMLLTLESVAVLALLPPLLQLVDAAGEKSTLELLHANENSALAHDILQSWAELGVMSAFEETGDESRMKDDLVHLSRETGRALSLWSCESSCICETRKLRTREVVLCAA